MVATEPPASIDIFTNIDTVKSSVPGLLDERRMWKIDVAIVSIVERLYMRKL